MKDIIGLLFFTFFMLSCSTDDNVTTVINPQRETLDPTMDYNTLLQGFDQELLLNTVEEPNDSGALGRNREGYFHVRFQLNMTKLTDLAVRDFRNDVLQAFLKNLDYSFSHQVGDGGFKLNPPLELVNNPAVAPASQGDSVSAVAFFAYGLGLSLSTLENSEWYKTNPQTAAIRSAINSYHSNIKATLDYLKDRSHILLQADQMAPNRLLFDAMAFYTLGNFLNDAEAIDLGYSYLQSALELVDQEEGYFIEGGGWDSSYNGVALKLGLEMYSLLPISIEKEKLGEQLLRAMDWQITRIQPNGEISTEGNTRVYPGGESFLGNEKTVDVEKTVRALMYFAQLTGNPLYHEIAIKVYNFYI